MLRFFRRNPPLAIALASAAVIFGIILVHAMMGMNTAEFHKEMSQPITKGDLYLCLYFIIILCGRK